jgi:CHAT domain-containing protein
VLTAEEVAALDLSGVRCVVLSACESGVGDVVLGEGVFGLRRAFLLAGAPTVVTSLSRVRDVPARAWTQAFYDAFARGVPASRAATLASRALLARGRAMHAGTHPSDWGAFIAIGGWR